MTTLNNLTIGKRIALTVVGLWLVGSSLLVLLSYQYAKSKLTESIRTRVCDLAALGAMSVPTGDHARLRQSQDEGTEAYARVIAALRRVRNSSPDIRFVYTTRKSEDGKVVFVADAEENEANRSHPGDVHEEAPPLLVQSIGGLTVPVVAKDFYQDKWGSFLSAYAPIRNPDGSFDGVLGIDISSASVQRVMHSLLWRLLALLAVITALIVPAAVVLSRSIVVVLKDCVEFTGLLAQGDFSQDVPGGFRGRGDEIGDLARAYHTMADNMRRLLRSMTDGVQTVALSLGELSAVSVKTAQSVHRIRIADYQSDDSFDRVERAQVGGGASQAFCWWMAG